MHDELPVLIVVLRLGVGIPHAEVFMRISTGVCKILGRSLEMPIDHADGRMIGDEVHQPFSELLCREFMLGPLGDVGHACHEVTVEVIVVQRGDDEVCHVCDPCWLSPG